MIRTVCENDAERLVEIYSYYVKETAVSFEYEAPTVEEFKITSGNSRLFNCRDESAKKEK